jgi:diguanylate cyclase (GGDEF)-like protein
MTAIQKRPSLWKITCFLCLQILIIATTHYFLGISYVFSFIIGLAAVFLILLLGWKYFSRWFSPKEVIDKYEETDESDVDTLNKELKNVTKKLQKQIYDLHSLFEVSINLTSILEPQQVIKSSMLSLIGQLQTNQTIVFLTSKSDGNALFPVYSKGFSKTLWKNFTLSLKDPVIDKFGEKMIAVDLLNIEDEFLDERWRKLIDNGITMIAPIISKKKIKGIIAVGQKMSKEVFSEPEQELFSLLVHFISVALSNSILYQRMEQISITDGLTGLYNHRYFKKRLENELVRAQRYRHSLSLVFFDVDHFKNYNDTLGHPAGDVALKTVAGILKSSIRKSDIAVRYGGEEFCVILPEGDIKSAFNFAERLRNQIESHHFEKEEVQPSGKLTISLGVASFPKNADSSKQLIDKADAALYNAKGSGRNRTCLISENKS